jgi:hypothetical protein
VEESTGEVNSNIIVIDNILRFKKSIALEFKLQNQWAGGLFKNWAAVQAEFNFTKNFFLFGIDLYNYGNNSQRGRLHFYKSGLAYKKGAFRIQSGYGRQRGELICVGGVSRFVPRGAGLNVSVSYSF